VLTQLQNTEEAGDIVSRVRDAVRQDVAAGQVVCSVSAAMGLAFYPQDGTDVRALLAAADERMYADKAASKTKRPT
jgi:GGDEF domain-containing protein